MGEKPVLVIQHSPAEHPALLDRALETQGISRLLIHPWQGDTYPEAKEISGIVSLGGPMGAYEEAQHPWIKTECQLLRKAFDSGLPILGICLGGQLLAKAMGARVERAPQPEIGWWPIELTNHALSDPIFGTVHEALGSTPVVYHWHRDTFHLPKDAILLAQTSECPRQAYRLRKNVYGLQFHPEVDVHLLDEWLEDAGAEDELRTAFQNSANQEKLQDSRVQKHYAPIAEEATATMTAVLGTLFRWRTNPTKNFSREDLEDRTKDRTSTDLEFLGPHIQRKLTGKIIRVLNTALGAFILFRTMDQRLWPIRTDDIISLT